MTPTPEEVETTIFGPDPYYQFFRTTADIAADDDLIDVLAWFNLREGGISGLAQAYRDSDGERFWWI